MNEELGHLLEKYEEGDLDEAQRRRLAELVATPEGRRQALASGAPEAVFLSRDAETPAWDGFWKRLRARVELHSRLAPKKFPVFRVAAAVAILAVAVFIYVIDSTGPRTPGDEAPAMIAEGPDAPEMDATSGMEERSFSLRHRLPADVLAELRPLLSDDAKLHVNESRRELLITDRPTNLERIERALAQLDSPQGILRMRLRLLYALGGDEAAIMREVDALGAEKIDPDKYRLEEEIELAPVEGRRHRALLRGRYLVQCFATISDDGTKIELRDFSIYDQQTQRIVRRSGLTLPLAGSLVIRTDQRNEQGEPLVIVLSIDNNE